jgi:hypothetical protein
VSAAAPSLAEMAALAVDLSPRVDALEQLVAELADRPNDTIAVPNTFFVTAEGVPAEAGAWQGQWVASDGYSAGAIVKDKGHLYTTILPIPAPVQPALPAASSIESGFNPLFPGNKDAFGHPASVDEWMTSGEPIEGALSFTSTAEHAADLVPSPQLHIATKYELWRLFAINVTIKEKLAYKLTRLAGIGTTEWGFGKVGAGNGSGQGLTGEGVTPEELEVGLYIVSVQHFPAGVDPAAYAGPWPFSLTLTGAGIKLIAGNPPPTEDGRWELML